MIPLLATGAAAGWAWNRANGAGLRVRAEGDFYRAFQSAGSTAGSSWVDAETSLESRKKAREFRVEMEGEFPVLKGLEHPVADEGNGFLQLCRFNEASEQGKLGIPMSLKRLMSGQDAWNSDQVRRELDAHADVVQRVEKIAAMTGRSSTTGTRIDVESTGLEAGQFLLAKARLAVEARNEAEALRLVTAVLNLAAHLREVESPSIARESAATDYEMKVGKCVWEVLLPGLGKEADLEKWKVVLSPRAASPADWAKCLRGEWQNVTEQLLMPVLFQPGNRNLPSDPWEVGHCYSRWSAAQVGRIPQLTWKELMEPSRQEESMGGGEISPRGREILNDLLGVSQSWIRVKARAVVIQHQRLAALELLERERAGVKFEAAMMDQVTKDPVMGVAFGFDPVKREVWVPEGIPLKGEMKPLKLPW